MPWLYVALGGALGSLLRFGVMGWMGRMFPGAFPYGTLCVNIAGSFVMGAFIGSLARFIPEHAQALRLFVAVGLLGGFTTFSAFSLDSITLLENGAWAQAALYITASVCGAVFALFAGLQLVRAIA